MRARDRERCSARATRATTWRSWPCARCRWPTTEISLTLPAEPGSLAQLRRRLAPLPARHRRRPSWSSTRSRSRSARRPATRSSTPTGPGDATFEVEVSFDGGELTAVVRDTRQLARQARRAPRPRAQHHRGPDGRRGGRARRRRHASCACDRRLGRGPRGVTAPAEIVARAARRQRGRAPQRRGRHDERRRTCATSCSPRCRTRRSRWCSTSPACRYLDSAAIEVLFDVSRRLGPAPPGAAARDARRLAAEAGDRADRGAHRGARIRSPWRLRSTE